MTAADLRRPAYAPDIERVDANTYRMTLTLADVFPPARKVVVLDADPQTNARLRRWAIDMGFDLAADYDGNPRQPNDFDFHLTLFASESTVIFPDCEVAFADTGIDAVELVATGFDVLGVDRRVPVLTVGNGHDDIMLCADMRKSLLSIMSAQPTFADWKPHVSLSYVWDGVPSLSELSPPAFPLMFDRVRISILT